MHVTSNKSSNFIDCHIHRVESKVVKLEMYHYPYVSYRKSNRISYRKIHD